MLIDKWIDQGPTEWSGQIALTAGQRYDIRMEFYENGGGAMARLRWSSPSQAKQIIPQTRLYLPGSGSQAEINWLVSDHLGTPRMIFDQTGSLANLKRHDYLPFGEEQYAGIGGRTPQQGYSGDSVRQQFTSKERDNETNLDYFLARYYSSTQGRFTSPDEFKGGPDELFVLGSGDGQKQALPYADITNPQSLNKYQYCYNNPLRYVDPDGHDVWESLKAFGQGVVGGAKEAANILMEGSPLVAVSNGVSKILTGEPLIAPFEAANQAQSVGMTTAAVAAVIAPGPGGKTRALSRLGQRAREIAGKLKPGTQSRTTTAVAEVVNANGTTEVLVGSSERTLRPAQREALQAGETAVAGPGHAEVTVINAAKANGQTVTRVEASRPICRDCQQAIKEVGARTDSPLRP